MSKALKKARLNYEKKRQVKNISFNTETEKELLEFANAIDFGSWVKEQIRKKIEK